MLWSSDHVIWFLKQLSVRLSQFVRRTQEHGFIFSLLHFPLHQHPHCRYYQCTDHLLIQHTVYTFSFIIKQVWSVLHSLHFTVVLFCSSDGFLEYIVDRCEFNSTELKDMEYIYSHYYNKIEYIRFSSSVGQYVGVTEFGVNLAKHWNNNTAQLNSTRRKIVTYCLNNIQIHDQAIIAKSGECVVCMTSSDHHVQPHNDLSLIIF